MDLLGYVVVGYVIVVQDNYNFFGINDVLIYNVFGFYFDVVCVYKVSFKFFD